jgi:hypothetical protein
LIVPVAATPSSFTASTVPSSALARARASRRVGAASQLS